MLFQLLDKVAFIEEIFECEVGFVEDCVDSGDVGVSAKSPEHVDGWVPATSPRQTRCGDDARGSDMKLTGNRCCCRIGTCVDSKCLAGDIPIDEGGNVAQSRPTPVAVYKLLSGKGNLCKNAPYD